MKLLNVLPGIVMVAVLAQAALGNHVCPPWGCFPAPSDSPLPAKQVSESSSVLTPETASCEEMHSMVAAFLHYVVGGTIAGDPSGGTVTVEATLQLGRPTEAIKKKASRMGLRKSKKYMRSLGRS